MRVCLFIEPHRGATYDTQLRLARHAEATGFEGLFRADHYGLYDYVRFVVAKIATVDAFYVGLLHGSTRVRYPYGYDDGRYGGR